MVKSYSTITYLNSKLFDIFSPCFKCKNLPYLIFFPYFNSDDPACGTKTWNFCKR